MNKRILLSIPLMLLLASCNPGNVNPNDGPGQIDPGSNDPFQKDEGIDENQTSGEEIEVEVKTDDVTVTDSGEASQITDLTVSGISYDSTKKLFTITSGGEFVFKGSFNGNILVNADEEDEVKITLEGFTIKSTNDSPIKCISAGELQVSIKSGTKTISMITVLQKQ